MTDRKSNGTVGYDSPENLADLSVRENTSPSETDSDSASSVNQNVRIVISAVILLICIIVVSAFFGDGLSNCETSAYFKDSDSSYFSEPIAPVIYHTGDTIAEYDVSVKYVSWEKWEGYSPEYAPEKNHKIIRAYFEIANLSLNDRSTGLCNFKCTADGEECNEYLNGENMLTAITTLAAGEKAEGYVYFSVPDNPQTTLLIYETSLWAKQQTFFAVE